MFFHALINKTYSKTSFINIEQNIIYKKQEKLSTSLPEV